MESWSHTVPTMKAFAVARDDAPAIEMIDVDAPTPRRDEAVIAVHAFSVNRGETFLLEREPAGWRPGKDISGSVVAACADGSGPAVGARVVAHVDAGGWAELVAVGSDRLVELPECVSHTDAATLPHLEGEDLSNDGQDSQGAALRCLNGSHRGSWPVFLFRAGAAKCSRAECNRP